jgi:alpha-1,2-mannosyltransferase
VDQVLRRLSALGLPAIAVVYALSAAACCALAVTSLAHFMDLHVYRLGGEAVLHGWNLYRLRFHSLPFTYAPFAAVILVGFAALPYAVAVALLTTASVVALPVLLYFGLRLPPAASWLSRHDAWRLAVAAAAAAIWLEPARTMLGDGQVDLLLGVAVLYDLGRPEPARLRGALIGLAAGIKLTPAIFAIYLLAIRRYRAAATAAATFAATVAIGFVALPASSAHYWGGTFLKPGHVSPAQNDQNQSLLGAMSRTLHSGGVWPLWLPLAIAVGAAGLALAARAHRAGNEALGFSLCAVTGLLVSPISWTHHWILAVPGLLIAFVAVCRDGVRGRPAAIAGLAAITVAAVIGWARLAREVPGSGWLRLNEVDLAFSEVYVVCGLATLTVAAVYILGRYRLADRGRAEAGPE